MQINFDHPHNLVPEIDDAEIADHVIDAINKSADEIKAFMAEALKRNLSKVDYVDSYLKPERIDGLVEDIMLESVDFFEETRTACEVVIDRTIDSDTSGSENDEHRLLLSELI